MSVRHRPRRIAAGAGLLAIVLGTGTLWALAGDADVMLARTYQRALADVDTTWSAQPSGQVWLSRAPATTPALAVGDTITIDARAGGQKTIRVTALEQIDGEGLGLAGVQFQIVTGQPVGSDPETVRFLFAVELPSQGPGVPSSDRAL